MKSTFTIRPPPRDTRRAALVDGSSSTVEVRGILSKSAPPLRRIVSTHHLIRQRPLLQRRHGRKLPTHLPPLSEEKLVIAEARYEAGATLKAIASDLGISRQSLAHQLRKRGLKLRGRAPEPHEVDEMRRRYEAGDSLETVGSRLGFSAGTVRTWLIDSGVAMRDTHGRSK